MDSLIEQIGDVLAPEESQKNFTTLLAIFDNIGDHPSEAKFRSLHRSKLQDKLHSQSLQLLEAVGFVVNGTSLFLPSDASLDNLNSAREVLQCLAMSVGDDTAGKDDKAADVYPDPPTEEEQEALDEAEAMRLSMEGQEPSAEQRDREVAEELSREAEEPKNVEFVRMNHEEIVIDDDAVERINEYCRSSGDKYVDPQFPPVARSLFMNEADANTWACLPCGARTVLPPVPQVPKTREEAEAAEALWQTINKCSGCGKPAHHVINVRYFQRPVQWLRPGVRCEGCELIYSHLPAGKELVSRMCPHFLRDHMGNTTVGAPWKLIRGEARAEDVCQGGIGNCWFAAALGTVAARPELVDNMFVTKEFNPYGAYHLRLCHAGEWRSILVDDLFPSSRIFEGYLDATTAYYSMGGNLCYLQGARRQIWVPLVEKAAAKLFGCWATMSGGTFAEALCLFTGFPSQRITGLYIRKETRRRLQERRQAIQEERTKLLMQGQEVPDDLDMDDDDIDNDAITWAKILSANENGYVMGMGCTEEGCEKTKEHIVEDKGLACPHAYGIMDAREVQVDGKLVRLIKLRNPWGERAPRTWKGDWGKDSEKWTPALQLQLGVVNRSGVKMEDDMGIFWMSFEDIREYFSAVEVCRVHQDWHEIRQKAWLPSGVGPGEAFDLTVFRKTQVDLVVWQEKNLTREGALGAHSTNVDVGLAVLRKRGIDSDGQAEYELIEYIERTTADDCSAEMILEGGFVYRLVPISFGLMQEYAPRRCVVAVHSVQKVELQKVPSSWHELACATFEGCRKAGKRRPVPSMGNAVAPGIFSYLNFEEGCGACFVVENTSDVTTGLQFDGNDCQGCTFTRGTSMVITAVPPRSRQVIMGVAAGRGGPVSMGFGAVSLGPEAAGFAVPGEQMHMSLPLLPPELRNPGNRPLPDEGILKRAPPEEIREETPTAKRANTQTDEELLAEALRLSMGQQPQSTSANLNEMDVDGDEEDELEAAIRLSMVRPAAAASEFSLPAAAAPPAAEAQRPSTADQKARLTEKVKQLFEEYRRSGMAPNEAATRALADAQRQLAAGG